jgi:hypoxanthine phosphoribosyltransferase
MPLMSPDQALAVLDAAEQLYSAQQIASALDRMAGAITATLERRNPLVLVVMNGGFIAAAQLLARLRFPLRVGYLHATRYLSDTRGGDIHWIAPPRPSVNGEVVLVVDDIFDEGDTLKAIVDEIQRQGATAVYSAVLVNKQHNRKARHLQVNFSGLDAPDRYLFGYGMDYKEYWRHLPDIYAVSES